jgi:hypothetical protein
VTALVLGSAAVADLTEIHGHDDRVDDALDSRFVQALDQLFVRLEEFPRRAAPRWWPGTSMSAERSFAGSPTWCSTGTAPSGSTCSACCTRPA